MKRILTIALLICLAACGCMGFANALAPEEERTIQLGLGNISGYDSETGYDYLYYGFRYAIPIKWRVLSINGNDGTYHDGQREVDSGDAIFLLSEYLQVKGFAAHVVNFEAFWEEDDGDGQILNNDWQGSDAQQWCKDYSGEWTGPYDRWGPEPDAFTPQELAAILATTKSDRGTEFRRESINILDGDRVFFLSNEDVYNSEYGFIDDKSRQADFGAYSNDKSAWWLRTPYARNDDWAGFVWNFGSTEFTAANDRMDARPAFNLNRNAVFMIAAFENGKGTGGAREELNPVSTTAIPEWQVTLLDSSRRFALEEAAMEAVPGETIQLHYSGATAYHPDTAPNEYISAMITDDGDVLYYGRVAQPEDVRGTAEIKVPPDIAPGEYTLSVFSEQFNSGAADPRPTDYASRPVELTLTVKAGSFAEDTVPEAAATPEPESAAENTSPNADAQANVASKPESRAVLWGVLIALCLGGGILYVWKRKRS